MLRASSKRCTAVHKELARRIITYLYHNHRDLLQYSVDKVPKKWMFSFTDEQGFNIEFSYTQNILNGDFYEGIIAKLTVNGIVAVCNNTIWIYKKEPGHNEREDRLLFNEYVVFSERVSNDFIKTYPGQSILNSILIVDKQC
jgi:hypothetical protein